MLLTDLFPLARDSVSDPRGVFRRLLALNLDIATLWQALVAITALSVILAELSLKVMLARGLEPDVPMLPDPFTTALVQFSLLAVLAVGIFWGGRALGGHGSLGGALLAVGWLQFVLACLQMIQMAVSLFFPFVSALIGLFGLGLVFWLLTAFTAELHGFRSMGKVFAGLVVGLFGLVLVFVMVLAIIGIGIPGAPDV